MESAHDQLFKVGSHKSIAFQRKYRLNGPIPESLTNYLDVSAVLTIVLSFVHVTAFSRLNTTVILVLAHRPNRFVLCSSKFARFR
jgi:hypothetical protein